MRRGPPSSGLRVVFGMSWRRNAIGFVSSTAGIGRNGSAALEALRELQALGFGGGYASGAAIGIELVGWAALAGAAAFRGAAGDQLVEHRVGLLGTEHPAEPLDVFAGRRGAADDDRDVRVRDVDSFIEHAASDQ